MGSPTPCVEPRQTVSNVPCPESELDGEAVISQPGLRQSLLCLPRVSLLISSPLADQFAQWNMLRHLDPGAKTGIPRRPSCPRPRHAHSKPDFLRTPALFRPSGAQCRPQERPASNQSKSTVRLPTAREPWQLCDRAGRDRGIPPPEFLPPRARGHRHVNRGMFSASCGPMP